MARRKKKNKTRSKNKKAEAMKKQDDILNESTVRRFMGLAGIGALSNTFVDENRLTEDDTAYKRELEEQDETLEEQDVIPTAEEEAAGMTFAAGQTDIDAGDEAADAAEDAADKAAAEVKANLTSENMTQLAEALSRRVAARLQKGNAPRRKSAKGLQKENFARQQAAQANAHNYRQNLNRTANILTEQIARNNPGLVYDDLKENQIIDILTKRVAKRLLEEAKK